jgi:hypothetical protein
MMYVFIFLLTRLLQTIVADEMYQKLRKSQPTLANRKGLTWLQNKAHHTKNYPKTETPSHPAYFPDLPSTAYHFFTHLDHLSI